MKIWGQPSKGRNKEQSQPSQKERPTTNIRDTCDRCDASTQILGMAKEQAIAIWDKQGRPVIHLGPSENCDDLAKLLAHKNIKLEHLSAIREWLEKHLEGNHE